MNNQRPLGFAVRFFFPFAFLLCTFSFASAQSSTATLSGTIEDQNGATIPGVQVTIENIGTTLKREATTNDEGSFTVPLLPPGRYVVTARRDGFAPVQINDVVLNVNDQKALRIELKAGDVNATVHVTSEAPLINESPTVATTIDRQFVGNLPLSGRSFQSLILLTPGIVAAPTSNSNAGEFSVNGQRQNANYFTVDGVSANVGVSNDANPLTFSPQAGGALPTTTASGTTASLVSVDALEEFKIQSSTYSAEFGRQPGGQVQLVTRSGSSQYRGSAFEYVRNDIFDARDWFNTKPNPKPALRQNQFGGTFSGPLMLPSFGEGGKPYWSGRNRTFFFFSYEGLRLRVPVIRTGVVVPSLRLRQAAAPALQPYLNAYPLPSGPEIVVGQNDPFAPIDPITNPPVPSGWAPFQGTFSSPSSVDAYNFRLDHTFKNSLKLFGRYADTPSSSLARNLNNLRGNVFSSRSLTVGASFSVAPNIYNDFRANYSSNRGQAHEAMDDFGGGTPFTLSQLTSGYSGPGVKFGSMDLRTSFRFFPQVHRVGDLAENSSQQINVVDNLSWVKGNHQFKFGADWRRLNSTLGPAAFSQYVAFFTEASITSGIPDAVSFSSRAGARPIYDNYSFYAQDTWRISQRLNMDVGVRWDINPAPHDADGLRPVVLAGISGTDVSNLTIAPPDAPFYKTSYGAVAPRIGIAYLLNQTSGRETVLRGGLGVYYDLGNGMASSVFGRYPFSSFVGLSGSDLSFPVAPALVHPPTFNAVPTQLPIRGQSFSALNPNLKLPYTLQWSMGLEQSLGNQQAVTISYVAAAARRLTTLLRLNNPISGVRPNNNVGNVFYVTNGPTSDYHSLQAQYQRRLSHRVQALVNYTWSHAIDEVSDEVTNEGLDRGDASFDVRHNFSAAVTYDLPKLRGTGPMDQFAKGVANGWSIDSSLYARTGLPLGVNFGGRIINPIDGTSIVVRPDIIPGVPFWIKDSTVAGGQRLNQAAFQSPPLNLNGIPVRQGTLGRNVVRLPGIYQVNLGLRRQFNLGERLNLQFKAEMFNVFNHPLFGNYCASIGCGSSFGVPESTLANSGGATNTGVLAGLNPLYQIGGPRSMQFSVRIGF